MDLEQGDKEAAAVQKPGTDRVSVQQLKDKVTNIEYWYPSICPHMTVCALRFDNGFVSIGAAAPMDPSNMDEELGKKFAYEDALRKLWPLEAYARLENKREK